MNMQLQKLSVAFGLALAVLLAAPLAKADSETLTFQQLELFNKANELFQEAQYPEITKLLQGEVERDKPHPYACILYGLAYMQMDDNQKAIEIFRKGLKNSPNYLSLHLNLGVALVGEQRHEEAGDAFMAAHKLDNGEAPGVYAYTAAQCYYFANMYARSLDAIKGVLGTPAMKPEWLNLAAMDCLQLSRWDEAEGYLIRLVEMQPDKRQNWKSLAYARLRIEKNNAAVAALDIAARLPEVTERDRKELSGLYRHAFAPVLSLEVEKLLPPSQEQEKIYISSLLRSNRQKQLVEYLDTLIAKKATPELYLIRGTAFYRMGDLKNAQASFHRGAAVDGKETERCRLLEGMVAWERREWESAKLAFVVLTSEESRYKSHAIMAILAIESMEEIEMEIAGMDRNAQGDSMASWDGGSRMQVAPE